MEYFKKNCGMHDVAKTAIVVAVACLLCAGGYGVRSCVRENMVYNAQRVEDAKAAQAEAKKSGKPGKWKYYTVKDDFDGRTYFMAECSSEKTEFESEYGDGSYGKSLSIILRRDKSGCNAFVKIQGEALCDSEIEFMPASGGDVTKLDLYGPSDDKLYAGRADMAECIQRGDVMSLVKSGIEYKIRVKTLSKGYKVFRLNTAGLKWK